MDAIEALRQRRSVRAYDKDRPVSAEELETIVDCGRLAASARNTQPWEFVVVTSAEMRRAIAEAANHGKFIADAPACVAVFCQDGDYWLEDGCAATQNMLLAAVSAGLGTCWLGIYPQPERVEGVRRIFGIPESIVPFAIVAVGYPARVPRRPSQFDETRIHQEKW